MTAAQSIQEAKSETQPRRFSQAPPRPPVRTIFVATLSSIFGLSTLALVASASGHPWLIPPMAASMALIMGAPQLPLSQPRNVIGGQGLSATVGVFVGLAGDSIWLAALAGGLALGAMMLCRMPHSPAAATAMIGVVTTDEFQFVVLATFSAVVLVLVGTLGNRFNAARYPVYLW